jgi:transcriptional regulator with XRE-family HTH domain
MKTIGFLPINTLYLLILLYLAIGFLQAKQNYMNSPIDTFHARKLRFLRRQKDLKQPDLAEALGYKQQTISDLENGKQHFTDEIIDKISAYFNITSAEFEQPIEQVLITNSPNANGYLSNSTVNDLKLLEANHQITLEALKSKDEALKAKDKAIEILETYIKQLEKNK